MIYRIASNPGDYQQCHKLMNAEGIEKARITFPTVMAVDKKEGLVGFLSTRIQDKMIIAGPLVLRSDRRRVFTAIKLAAAYEMAMRNLGIQTFIFHGPAGGLLERAIKRYYPHATPYAEENGIKFWTWRLSGGQQSISSRPV